MSYAIIVDPENVTAHSAIVTLWLQSNYPTSDTVGLSIKKGDTTVASESVVIPAGSSSGDIINTLFNGLRSDTEYTATDGVDSTDFFTVRDDTPKIATQSQWENLADRVEETYTSIDEVSESVDDLAKIVPICFDNVAGMVASGDLVAGSYAQTLGYYAKGDYGSATYKISDEELTADGSTIIALDNGLFAVLNLDDRVIKAEQFGAKGDGTTDDTVALQAAINYSIAHECVLELNGDYLVEPTQRDDNTMVCLTYTKRNTGLQYVGAQIRFNRSARLKTDYADECTLLRIEARNIVISEGYFSGVQNKTTLMEFSRTNTLSESYDGYNMDNIIENCIFRYAKNAITLEGSAYYNKFNSDRIFSCTNGIVLQMTALEKAGLHQDSNVNRNHFNDICMNGISGWAVRIEYGAHNEFVGLDIEGAGNGVYLDNPYSHSGDFPIAPLNSCDSNKFVNVMMESITTTNWYNNQQGTCIYNTIYESDWGSKSNMVIPPQVFLGGDSESGSIEKFSWITCNKDLTAIPSMLHNTVTTPRFMTAGGYFDNSSTGGVYVNMNLQNLEFDTTKAGANIDSITYNSSKPQVKRVGGIVHITGSFYFTPTSTSSGIKLYLPESWQVPKAVANNFIGPFTTVVGFINNAYVTLYARVYTDGNGSYIEIVKPDTGWNAGVNYILMQDFSYLANIAW